MKNEILSIIEIAYKKGYLDGMNFERDLNGDDQISEEEFKNLGVFDAIEEAVKKISEKYE